MAVKSEFVIPFAGLSLGKHDFSFEISDSFFEAIEYSEIEKGRFQVNVTLEKHKTMLIFEFDIKGSAQVPCDRCLEEVTLPVGAQQRLIVKFGPEEAGDNENITYIPANEYEIDITHYIYENIMLALPYSKVHEEGGCDPEVIKKLEELSTPESKSDDDEIDPRWSALKDLN